MIQTPTTLLKQPIIKARQLTIEELKSLDLPLMVQNNTLTITQGLRGFKLKHPITLKLDKVLAAKEKGLVAYIFTAFLTERPGLLQFVFDNQSLLKMARHFLRHCSGSFHSCLVYTASIQKFSEWLGYNPDLIIQDVKPVGAVPDPIAVQRHGGFLNDYLAELQDEGLKPGAVNNYIKAVKTFYRVNGVKLELSEPLSRRVTYKDRSPKPEELVKLLDVADLRQKVMVSLLALGAFREGTLAALQYRHVREDLENNVEPIHVHVETEITKGKYGDYDTFLRAEASLYLKLYIAERHQGNRRTQPEELTDISPLIRDEHNATPRSITPKQIRRVVHGLYVKAGLAKQREGHYDLRVHSLRKYFKTQLLAAGIQSDYVDYMMGHTIDTYHDIQSVGIDKLRNVYSASGISIRKETKVSKLGAIKEMIRAMGVNPEQVLAKDAMADGATTIQGNEDREMALLRRELKELIRSEASISV